MVQRATKDGIADHFDLCGSQTQRRLIGRPVSVRVSSLSSLYKTHFSLVPLRQASERGFARIIRPTRRSQEVQDYNADAEQWEEDAHEDDQQVLHKRQILQPQGDGFHDAAPAADGEDFSSGVFVENQEEEERRQMLNEPRSEASTQVRGIKLISRDRKSQRVKLCGWEIDGWSV